MFVGGIFELGLLVRLQGDTEPASTAAVAGALLETLGRHAFAEHDFILASLVHEGAVGFVEF